MIHFVKRLFWFASVCALCLTLAAACSVEEHAAKAGPSTATSPSAVPLAKPHKKLGVEMHHLSQQRSAGLVEQARQRNLLVKEGLLLVQLAYEGQEAIVADALGGLNIPIMHRFPRFQRLDVGLRSYADLDAVISMGSIYRIEALSVPVVRTDNE
ncbi:MAG TPA: hypothetical protein DIW43_05505 [Spongiibacteraceae bacterium]|nr:hypothetical protein [Spongiibacteraceae bacterium]HCS26886.1 hypothetical protein [Spongiibacteraceae bacterium]|tara:strand:- start:527 stop:991 length:465 start_codon:yes stop_codon:yes gene_type:complete